MVKGDSKDPKFWITESLDHLHEAREKLEKGDRKRASLWIHQSLKFGLKGALIAATGEGLKLGKGHDLGLYLQELMEKIPEQREFLAKYEDLMDRIDPMYSESRYPHYERELPSSENLATWLEQAEQLIQGINKLVTKARA